MIVRSEKDRAFSFLSPRAQLQVKLTEARTDDEKLLVAIGYNEPSLVKFYLEAGVSANSPEGSNTSPIFYAAVHKNPLLVKMLLGYGANPNFEHRMTHSTILGNVFNDYDHLMERPVLTEQLNKLVMIAALMQHAGLRFDTPNSRNESPLDKFGLWVGPERKEQVLAEFLDKIAHADINTIRSADVIARPPEAIIQLSSNEEQKVAVFRAGRYAEILNDASTRSRASRFVAFGLLNRFPPNQRLDRSAAIRIPMGIDSMGLDRLGLPITDRSSAVEHTAPGLISSAGPSLSAAGVNLLEFIRLVPTTESSAEQAVFALAVQRSLHAPAMNASSQQPNILSAGPNAETIDTHAIPYKDIPEEYICPLTGQIMSDPVYLENDRPKQGFERTWLIEWLSKNQIHPLNRRAIVLTEITQYADLKNEIDSFVEQAVNNSQNAFNIK
jgi:hypothetical protein